MSQYVALLRGINVGGKNIIKMVALKACLESHGFEAVTTYIQSGNVLFKARGSELTRRMEDALAKTFKYRASVVLRSRQQMQDIAAQAPESFGSLPAQYRYDVLFLKEPLTATVAMKSVPTKPGVDQAQAGPGVVYFSRLISRATQSQLSRIVSLPIYQSMTIRNWNTTTKLLAMMLASEAP
jgi:uncharacterized protein (DUF1697 family)